MGGGVPIKNARTFSKIQSIIDPLLAGRAFENDDDLYLFLILQLACGYCFLIHGILLLFYLADSLWPMVIYNTISILCYCFCYRMIRRKAYCQAGLIITVEVALYTLVSILLTGLTNNIILYVFLVMILQVITPYASLRLRTGIIVALWVGVTLVSWLGGKFIPVYNDGNPYSPLAMLNIQVGIIGIIVELSVGTILRELIANYNSRRMDVLEDQANTDPLTKLYNRRYADTFFSRLRTGELGRVWCVAMLDIDDFKKVNDTYGHGVGDEVLADLARLLQKQLRQTDMLFRWGGEEFLILLKDVSLEAAVRVLEKIRLQIAETAIPMGGDIISITVTMGVAPLKPECIEESIDLCDKKLYEGKITMKNRVVK